MKIRRPLHSKFFWLFAAAAVVALLFDEQVAVLYVLATLAMSGVLLVVAFSNLEARDAEMQAARAIREDAAVMSTRSRHLLREKKSRARSAAQAEGKELNDHWSLPGSPFGRTLEKGF
jgi:hypothetical protein